MDLMWNSAKRLTVRATLFGSVCAILCGLSPAQGATFAIIDAPGAGAGSGQGTGAYGINNLGAVTGFYEDSSGYLHGFLLAADGVTFTTFDANGAKSQT